MTTYLITTNPAAATNANQNSIITNATTYATPNYDNYDYSQAYGECFKDLNVALTSTKSQKLREIIQACINRLQQMKGHADHVTNNLKQIQQFGQPNQYLTTQNVQPQQQQNQFQTCTFTSEGNLVPYYTSNTGMVYATSIPASAGQTVAGHQIIATGIPQEVVKQGGRKRGQKFQPTDSVHIVVTPSLPVYAKPQDQQQQQIQQQLQQVQVQQQVQQPGATPKGRSSAKKESTHKLFIRSDEGRLAKERDVQAAMERAKNHDFGSLVNKYDRNAIMAMAESGARESIKNFVNYHMVEPLKDPTNDRMSYVCKEPECNNQIFRNYVSAVWHCLKEHLNQFRPFACSQCSLRFYIRKALREHFAAVHEKIKRFKCPREGCQFGCNTNWDLKKHLDSHDKVKRYKCTWEGCNKVFSGTHGLKDHLQRHEGKRFSCSWPGCSKQCSTEYTLKNHLNRHKALASKRYKCKFCDYFAADNKACADHMMTVHSYPRPWTDEEKEKRRRFSMDRLNCDYCSKSFRRYNLQNHIKRFHSTEPKPMKKFKDPVTCPFCLKVYSKSSLGKHIRAKHSSDQPDKKSSEGNLGMGQDAGAAKPNKKFTQCTVCDKLMESKSFRSHFLLKHQNIPFSPDKGLVLVARKPKATKPKEQKTTPRRPKKSATSTLSAAEQQIGLPQNAHIVVVDSQGNEEAHHEIVFTTEELHVDQSHTHVEDSSEDLHAHDVHHDHFMSAPEHTIGDDSNEDHKMDHELVDHSMVEQTIEHDPMEQTIEQTIEHTMEDMVELSVVTSDHS